MAEQLYLSLFIVVCPAMVTPDQISTFFNTHRHKNLLLAQFHLIPSSTKLHWPSTKYQLVLPHKDPVPPSTDQYHPVCTQNHHISSSTPLYWPITTKYQPVPPQTDTVPSSTDQCHPLLTHYHHISTNNTLYWPITTKYQPVPPHTDPVPPSTNQCRLFSWASTILYHIQMSDFPSSTWDEHSCTLV